MGLGNLFSKKKGAGDDLQALKERFSAVQAQSGAPAASADAAAPGTGNMPAQPATQASPQQTPAAPAQPAQAGNKQAAASAGSQASDQGSGMPAAQVQAPQSQDSSVAQAQADSAVQSPNSVPAGTASQPASQASQPKSASVNVVEIEGNRQTEQPVEIDKSFEDVILAQADEGKPEPEEEEINKKSIASYLNDIKENYEDAKLISLVIQQIKELIEIDNNLNAKIGDVEVQLKKEAAEREKLVKKIEANYKEQKELAKNMDKFVALYELVTNQFNPFLENQGAGSKSPQGPGKPGPALPAGKGTASDTEGTADLPEGTLGKSASMSESEQMFQRFKEEAASQPGSASTDTQSSGSESKDNQEGPSQSVQHQENLRQEDQPQENHEESKDTGSLNGDGQHEINDAKPEAGDEAQEGVKPQQRSDDPGQPGDFRQPSETQGANNMGGQAGQQPQAGQNEEQKQGQVDLSYHPEPIKQTKRLPEHLHFVLKDGRTIDSLTSLLLFFKESDDATISEYVTHYKHDFSAWIYHTFHNEHLSGLLSEGKTREQLIRILEDYIKSH